MKLTKDTVAALKLDGKTDAIFFDDEVAGFGVRLRLGADGKVAKSYVAQRKRGGRTFRRRFGSAERISPSKSREVARKWLAKIDLGEDPQADRRDRRAKDALTLRSQAAEFLAAKKPDLAASSLGEATRYLTNPKYFGPLHSKALDSIALRDVAARVVVIGRECGDASAARARGALSNFFTWAMRMGLATANPCIGSINPEIMARDRVLSLDEIAAIWKACGDDDYGKIVRLLILLGARRQEIGGMAWPEFSDLDGPQPPRWQPYAGEPQVRICAEGARQPSWTLPKARSKNGRAHTLPLLPMALAIIRSVPRRVSRDQLFGTSAAEGFSSWGKGKAALDRCCAVENFRLHDIRRSTATGMADIGIAPHVIEAILNHQSGHKSGIAGIYNRSSYVREVRAALALWEDHIRTLIDGVDHKIITIATKLPFEAKRGHAV